VSQNLENKDERRLFALDVKPGELYEWYINPLLKVSKEEKYQILMALFKCNNEAEQRMIRSIKNTEATRGENLMKCLEEAKKEIEELKEKVKILENEKIMSHE